MVKEMVKFGKIEVREEVLEGLNKQNIQEPTKVQEAVYESIMEDKDMVVQSETGSGKTLAYLLPLFERYKEEKKANKVIVLVPTQELAIQVHQQVELFAQNSGLPIGSAVIFGKVNIERQIKSLREKPLVIVGTCQRILELIKKKKINGQSVHTIVIDEADKMLDKKMVGDVNEVIKCTLRDRQLLFFSASMPQRVIDLAQTMAKEPIIIKNQEEQKVPKHITHQYIVVNRNERIETLRKLVNASKDKKAMIFINGQHEIEEALMKLKYHQYGVEAIYKNVDKFERKKAIESFKNSKVNYLIATDIAARGLHFDDVDLVVHLTLPEESRDYLHRAGRTGRNGAEGTSVSIVTEREVRHLQSFSKSLGIPMEEITVKEGKIIPVKHGEKKKNPTGGQHGKTGKAKSGVKGAGNASNKGTKPLRNRDV